VNKTSVKIGIEITADDKASPQVVAAVEKIANSLQGLEKTGENVVTTTNNMAKSAEKLGSELDKASGKVANSQDKMQVSTKDTVFAFNNLATAAFSIYNAYDRVADYAVQVDRANLMVKQSANAVEDAQVRYNVAVEKFGPASEQARLAAQDLANAQERYGVAVERANMMAGNFNETILQSALTVIPTSMTALDSIIRITKAFQLAEEGSVLAKIASAGASVKKTIVEIAGAVASKLAAAADWIHNAALTVKIGLLTLGIGLIAVMAAITVTLAMQSRLAAGAETELSKETLKANEAMAAFQVSMDASYDSAAKLTDRISLLKSTIGTGESVINKNNQRLAELNDLIQRAETYLNSYINSMSYQTRVRESGINALKAERDALLEQNGTMNDNVQSMKQRTVELERMAAVDKFYFETFTQATTAWQESVVSAAQRVRDVLEDTTLASDQSLQQSATIIQDFATQWNMTWDDAAKTVYGAVKDIIKEEDKLAEAAKKASEEQEKIFQKHADWLENAYFNRVTQKTEKFTSDLQLYGNAYNLWLGLSTDMTIAIVQQFADLWGVSWDTAAKILEDYVNEQQSLLDEKNRQLEAANAEAERIMQEHLATISTYYFENYTAKTADFIESQKGFAKEFIDILENQNIDTQTKLSMAESLISQFAAQWGISWQDAEKIIQEAVAAIEAATAQVPKTIKEQLIDRAQANLEAFKNCASGKFYDITKDSKASWDTLVTDTNDLITAGLLGQAQDNIQAFVDCSTNKQADMVKQIDGYLADLTQEYDANIAKIAELVAAGKTEEAAILEAENADIMAKIQQLEAWKQMIIQESWNTINATTAQGVANEIAQIALLQGRWEALYALLETKGVGGERYMPEPPKAGEGLVIPTLPITPILETPALPIPTIPPAPAIPTPTPPILQINSPLVVVEGSADRATAELAANLVADRLKSVIVEASSSGAPATSKRIRFGNVVG
jgi:hypothetical protein